MDSYLNKLFENYNISCSNNKYKLDVSNVINGLGKYTISFFQKNAHLKKHVNDMDFFEYFFQDHVDNTHYLVKIKKMDVREALLVSIWADLNYRWSKLITNFCSLENEEQLLQRFDNLIKTSLKHPVWTRVDIEIIDVNDEGLPYNAKKSRCDYDTLLDFEEIKTDIIYDIDAIFLTLYLWDYFTKELFDSQWKNVLKYYCNVKISPTFNLDYF